MKILIEKVEGRHRNQIEINSESIFNIIGK